MKRDQMGFPARAGCFGLALVLTLALGACAPADQSAGSASQSAGGAGSSAPVYQEEGTLCAAFHALEGDCLVLAADGCRYRFQLNGVPVDGLLPGDPVTVTYTGTLVPDSQTASAVLLSLTRDGAGI